MIFAKDRVSSLAMRELRLLKPLAIYIAVLMAVGVLLGIIGPFGTFDDLSTINRFAYWIIIVVLNGLQAQVAIAFSSRLLPFPKWPAVIPMIAGSFACSLLATFEVFWLENIFRPQINVHDLSFAEIYFFVLVITLVVAYFFVLGPLNSYAVVRHPSVMDAEAETETGIENETQSAPPPFFKRLPAKLGTELICLEMEDHYVRAHTVLGNDLILMRMKDAVTELEGFDGMQVHRSFWVARGAITSVRRSGERGLLTMSNGMEIPVSRTRLRQLLDKKLLEI
ncbi:MAG: LytTR family transcriptional regulator DNA-binding domain-containing protein [Alphaproteobacteria bacterium]|nr:LytTR family transcriptional regulator DNA-binding domain-containing protein [Alphaproteobacteria bacterium]